MAFSFKDQITLREEISILKDYIELEQIRLENTFDYKIVVQKELDIDWIKIPPMLIQPLVENAVWHGIVPGNQRGMIERQKTTYVHMIQILLI